MTLYAFTDKKVLTVREQLQEDLITLLDSQFGEVDYLDDVKDLACQIVIDRSHQMTLTQELKTYSFTDEQIDFILDIITNNSEYEDDEELGQWMKELSRQIEDQIVNHMENEGL
jgi:hypothetical protein